jgi:hypothetical protein
MNGWLPENLPESLKPTPGMAERIASGVKARNERRKKLVREAWAGLGTAAFVAIVALLVVPAAHITAGRAQRPSPTVQAIRPASPGAGNASFVGAALRGRPAPSPTMPAPRATAPDLTLSKVDHLVEVAWQGNKNGEYVVYRCTSPKFDQCSLADRVKGTTWVDTANEPGIIYYRVEPKG